MRAAVVLAAGLLLFGADAVVAADGPRVPIRAAAHERGRVRFVFDWPVSVGARVEQNGDNPRVVFEATPQFDTAKLPRSLAPLVRLDGATATFALRPGGSIRQFRNGRSVVVDLVQAQPVAATTASAPPAPATTASPPAVTSVPPSAAPPAVSPPAAPAAAAATAPKPASVQPAAPPAVASPTPPPVRPAPPPTPLTPPPSAPVRPVFGAEIQTTVRREAAAVSLHFAWPEGVRVAAFARDGRVWVVFDRPGTVPVERLAQAAGELLPAARQLPAPGATVLRLDVLPGFWPRVARDAAGWSVDLLPGRQRAARPLLPQVEPGARRGGPVVVVPVDSPGLPIAVRDPELGDRMLIVPTAAGDLGLDEPFRVPEFRLLPSTAGLVLVPEAEALPVTVTGDRVRIGGDAGLLLSGGPLDAPREAPVRAIQAPAAPSMFDFHGWAREDTPFTEARQALAQAVAAQPPERRTGARLELAQFLFARGFADEAAGVIDLIAADDPDRADQPAVRALRGATLLLTGDAEAAKGELFRPSLDGIAEIGLWRGAWHAGREEWRPALAQFDRGWAFIESYPKGLQERFGLLAAEAALETGNGRLAGERVTQLERLKSAEPIASRVAYLRGRLLAGQGAAAEAIALWRKVEAGPDRLAQVRSALARLDIELRDGLIQRPAAIEELERLRFVWRGDGIELAVLERLGRCYLEEKDYWNGLSTLRYALSVFGNTPRAAPVAERMAEAFRRLFVAGEARALPPLKAMALFEEYRELAPLGPDGDVVLRELAGRLLALDLLGPAADLLDHQMRYRLDKRARADAGAALALIRLLDRKPQAALDALDASEGDAPAELGTRRRQLRARALLEAGRAKEALAALGQDRTIESEALRADLAWRAGDWAEAARAFARTAPATAPVDDAGARIVLKWAVALSLAGKRDELRPLWTRYGPAMAGTSSEPAFRMIAGDQSPDPAVLATVARSLAEADEFGAALRRWRRAVERGDSVAGNGA